MTRRRLQNQLEALLKKYDSEIERAFLEAVRNKANSISLKDLTAAIEARDFNRALRIAGISRADLFPFDTSLNSAYVAGGQTVAGAAPAFAAAFGFDGRATRAEQWARSHVGGLVTNIVDEQVDLLRETISRQIGEGVNSRKVALEIAGRTVNGTRQGGIVGLSRPQKDALDRARRELTDLDSSYFNRKLRDRRFDGLVRKAIADGKALSQKDKDRIASRYSDRLLKRRADTIARTESITALRAGRREGVAQGIDAGAINPSALRRRWSSTDVVRGGRTRDDHVDMNGQEVSGMDEPFVAPDGSRLLFPGDRSLGASAAQTIQCRCYDEYVVDWLRG